MPPLPPRDHRITREQAQGLINRRRGGGIERGGAFLKDAIAAILDQPGCVGLRYYFGANTDGSTALILVGVDEENRDMSTGTIIDNHYPCPPFCPDQTDLA